MERKPDIPEELLSGEGLLRHIEERQRNAVEAPSRELVLPSASRQSFGQLLENRIDLENVSPRFFEELVAELLRADGYEEVNLIRRVNAPGPDIIAYCPSPSGSDQMFIVECKRWANPEFSPPIRQGPPPVL